VREKLKSQQPDILVSAGTSHFQVLDIMKVDEIMAAAEPAKERLKAQLARVLSVETLPQVTAGDPVTLETAERPPAKPKRRGLLSRRKGHRDKH
jgi:NTE family protein